MKRQAVRGGGEGRSERLGRRPASMMCMNPVNWREATSLREIKTSESLICLRDSRYTLYMYSTCTLYMMYMYIHVYCIHVCVCWISLGNLYTCILKSDTFATDLLDIPRQTTCTCMNPD